MRKYFDNFAEWLCGFEKELFAHVLVTMIVAAAIARVCLWTGADRILAGCFAGFVTFCLGFIKESWDSKVEGVFEGKDILANFIGAVLFFITWV